MPDATPAAVGPAIQDEGRVPLRLRIDIPGNGWWDPPSALRRLEELYKDMHSDMDPEFEESLSTGYDERIWIARDYAKGWFNNLDSCLA